MSEPSYFDRAQAYARRCVDGVEGAGRLEILAAKRFLDDLARQGTDDFPYVVDEIKGGRACRFQELLPHIKGEWAKPVYIDGKFTLVKIKLEDWQVFIEFQLFAWVHQATGLRRFTRDYEEIARKNAKSTRVAARQLYMLTADGEPGAQCYSAATTGKQAREVFDVSREMALRCPTFLARFGVNVGKNDITVASNASSYQALNAEGTTLDGLNVHSGVVDEVHAHKKRAVWDVLDTATGARSQALLTAITTAGSDRSGICYELRRHTIKVLEGVVRDDTWFGIIFTIDEGDDWRDEKVWRKANPNLGISVKLVDMRSACKRAEAVSTSIGNFLTKRLNVWVNADSAWMDMQAWDRCANPELTYDDIKHLPCWVPLDLASKIDIAAAPIIAHDESADVWYCVTRQRFWLPTRAVETGVNSQYDGWVRDGWLVATPGEVTDYDMIEDQLLADARALQDLREVPFDPHQATQLSSHMLAQGLPMVEMRPVVLNFSEPMKQLQALVLQGPTKFQHDGSPAMAWMMSNVVCHLDHKDNIYPRKERDEDKIDGPVAAIMGIGRAMAAKTADSGIDAYLEFMSQRNAAHQTAELAQPA